MSVPIESLRNIGPKSGAWLQACGIFTVEDHRSLGSVTAYQLVERSRQGVSRSLLWALEAGLQYRDWRDLKDDERTQVRRHRHEID